MASLIVSAGCAGEPVFPVLESRVVSARAEPGAAFAQRGGFEGAASGVALAVMNDMIQDEGRWTYVGRGAVAMTPGCVIDAELADGSMLKVLVSAGGGSALVGQWVAELQYWEGGILLDGENWFE